MKERSPGNGSEREEKSDLEETPLGLITDEEIRALLSPFGESPATQTEPALIVEERLEEKEALATGLRGAGVPVVFARNAFVAADMLRSGSFRAFVVALEALPPEAETFLGRVRRRTPSVSLCFVRNPGERMPDVEGADVLARPLADRDISRLASRLSTGTGSDRGQSGGPPGEERGESAGGTRNEPAPKPGPDLPSREPRLDPLAAVKAALEARLAGEEVVEGLARWAAAEPTIRGAARLVEDFEASLLRITGEWPSERRQMGLQLLHLLEERRHDPTRSAFLGSFSFFPGRSRGQGGLALFHEDPEEGRAFLDRLAPLLPLLDSLERGEASPASARARFVALLDSRMRASERAGSRLGILLLRGGGKDDPEQIAEGLRGLLRGGDWVETVDSTAYVILDQPNEEGFTALGRRLRALPGVDRLQVAALGWAPGDEGAEALVERAERILRSGGRGGDLPDLTPR